MTAGLRLLLLAGVASPLEPVSRRVALQRSGAAGAVLGEASFGATAAGAAVPAGPGGPEGAGSSLASSQCFAVLPDSTLKMAPKLEKRGSLATVAAFKRSRAVFLGEHHNSLRDHVLQARILEAARRSEPRRPMAVGLEAVQRQFQPVLDAYSAGEATLADVERLTEWEKRWFWPFERYAPVFEAAKAADVRLLALNADSEDLALVEAGGLKALPKATLATYVPSGPVFRDFANTTAFKEYVSYVIVPSYQSHKDMGILKQTITGKRLDEDMSFQNFYSGRMLWDNSMATVAGTWVRDHPKGLLFGIIGADHVKFGGGVPNRMADAAGLDLDDVTTVVLNPSVVDTAGPQLARLQSDEDQIPLTLQIRFAAAEGDGGIPVVGGDAKVDTLAAANRKQTRAGSRVLPFADFLWLSA